MPSKFSSLKLIAVAGFLVVLLWAGIVFAQGKEDGKKFFVVDELFVTAMKDAQPLKYVAGEAGIIKQEVIENTTTNDLGEVLARILGVTAPSQFGSNDVRITIRGVGHRTNFGVRSIIILLDGIPLTEADGQTRLDVIDMALIERVEVFKVPASAIYGGNASGGVINLITKKGESGLHYHSRAQYGTFDFGKTTFDHRNDIA